MRVCVQCGKYGPRVETCTDKSKCRIADKGTMIVPASDVIPDAVQGNVTFEVPPLTGPLPGDAMIFDPFTVHLPPAGVPRGSVVDPLPAAMSAIHAAKAEVASGPPLPLRGPRAAPTPSVTINDIHDAAIRLMELRGRIVVSELAREHGATTGKIAAVPAARFDDLYSALTRAISAAEKGDASLRRLLTEAERRNAKTEAETAILSIKPPVVTSPDGNPKTAVGITKPSLHSIPPLALLHLGQAMADGNRKYGLVNWRHDPITMSVYIDAIWRHFLALWDGQDADPKTGIKHLAYIMANCAILLDAEAQGTLTDDRSPIRGKTAELIEQLTNAMKETDA